MNKLRNLIILIVVCILVSNIFNLKVYAVSMSDTSYISTNLLKGIEIVDINTPEIIIKSWSKFEVNVTVKNTRALTSGYTVLVYLKTEGKGLKSNQKVIGFKYFQIGGFEEKTISVSCDTLRDWWKWLIKENRASDSDQLFNDGYIGVKIIRRPVVGYIIPRLLIDVVAKNITDSSINRLFNKISNDMKIIKKGLSCLVNLGIFKILFSNSLFITWKHVKLIDPVIYNCNLHPIKLEWYEMPNETDGQGRFNFSVNISNSYCSDIPICVAFYLDSGADVPVKIVKHYQRFYYIIGYYINKIPSGRFINTTIECEFPNENLAPGKYYDVMFIYFDYLPIKGNINCFGRKIVELDAKLTGHDEYSKYPPEVKNFWHELGDNVTFCMHYSPIYTFANPREHGKIFYKEKTYWEERIEELLDEGSKKLISWMPIFYLALLSLIGFACLGYWFARKKSK